MARLQWPRFALVLWPDGDQALPACVTLDAVSDAAQRGALVIAREDDILRELPPAMDMNLLSNPRRHDDQEDGA